MRATKAYIASIGTTGLLLAFSASLLVVVGALFAFDAWPGAQIRDAVESVVVDDEEPFAVGGPTQVALDAAPAAAAVAPAGAAGPGAAPGGEAGGDLDGPRGPGDGTDGGRFDNIRGGSDGDIPGGAPDGGDGDTPVGDPIDTGPGTNDLADRTEQVTRDLGNTVGTVNPQLGNTVSDTGQALSDIVRDLPDVQAGGGGVKAGGLSVGK